MSYCQNEYLSVKIDKKAQLLKRSQWLKAPAKIARSSGFPGPTPDATMVSFGFNHRF